MRSLICMLNNVKMDFMNILVKTNKLPELFNYLLKSSVAKDAKKKSLIPLAWLEARITNIRVNAMENCRSLINSVDMKCKVLKQKQLIFTYKDKESGCMIARNAQLCSGINLHMCTDSTSYIVSHAKSASQIKEKFGNCK